MLLSILLVVLLFAIAFLQATQGLFSALIMTVFTVCCAAAALGTYEWVAIHWLAPLWQPDYAHAIAVAAIFGVPLIVLRAVTDKLVRRACLLPAWVDRIGGGFCGLITALLVVGIIAHALQMIPFNAPLLGYARVARALPGKEGEGSSKPPDPNQPDRELFFRPDRFAIGFASALSAGVFGGQQILGYDTPDMVEAVGWNAAVPAEVSRYAPPNSINVVRAESVPFVYKHTPVDNRAGRAESYDPLPPSSGHEYLMVRVKLRPEARDERKSFTFTTRQFRLVGRPRREGPLEQFHAIAIQQEDATQALNRHIRTKVQRGDWPVVDEVLGPRDPQANEVEVVFEIPTGFTPEYVEYKRGARAAVQVSAGRDAAVTTTAPSRTEQTAAVTPPPQPSAEGEPQEGTAPSPRRGGGRRPRQPAGGETVPESGSGGNIRGLTTRQAQSGFKDTLPMPMKSYRQLKNARLKGDRLIDGHLVGEITRQENGTDPAVSKFEVPSDKRLLQLSTTRLQTRSGLGRAIDFAASTVQNYFVQDASGNRYSIVGKYAVADVEGTGVVEVQYFSEPVGSIGGLGKFDRIKDSDLTGDYELVLLFLVDPGVEVVSFSTGGSATRADDLREENLIAPD